ncbi:MAG: uroporphyrinogen-III C-methyltransferase [Lachnospiraceae bacterium]
MGKVILVGAGPGDAGLITVKGLEKLKSCDAVVYDRLASEELLKAAPMDCKKIYVGKEVGRQSKTQEEINAILIECAGKYDIVVRLKGGDPFVFGRGGEEIEALRQFDIPYEVIPGVTSAVAVPECAGIPVTHRGIARSFHVIAGHTRDLIGGPDYDYELLGKLEGTLIFLMGLANLEEITGNLVCAGKPAATPAAVISQGTTTGQKMVKGSLSTIAKKVKESKLQSPAVIVIGKTAEYEFLHSSPKAKRVGIIATKLLGEKLAEGLEKRGMRPIPLCRMEVLPTKQMERLDGELRHLEHYGWILFTSQNAIPLFFGKMKELRMDIRILSGLKFAALGNGTAEKLLEYGIKADFIPSVYTASVLAEEFAKIVRAGEKVLIPRAVQGSRELTHILAEERVDFLDLGIYDVTGRMTPNISCLEEMDYLLFASASGVKAFFDKLGDRVLSFPKEIRMVCIGKITQKKLLERYTKADVAATAMNVEELLDKIEIIEGKAGLSVW